MAKKLIDILSDAAVVRDETNEKANTAERVGGVLVELANYLSNFAPVSDVTVEADGSNVRLVLHLKNEDGTVSTRGVTLPAATTANAGVLTPELLKALQATDRANEDLAKEGISKAESASAMLFAEEAARKEADLSLNDLIEAEVTERLQSVATETAARKAADDELRAIADEGLSKADAALSQIHEERQERAAQDRTLAEAVSQERTERTTADAELSASISAEEAARTQRDAELTAVLTAETNTRLTADRDEKEARKTADAELLKRIIGKSTFSSAYNDPFKYLKDYQSEKDASGTITKHAIRVMQDALLDTLRHSDYRDSFPYIGHMRAHIEGVPIEMWTYVKAWNTGSTNGVFVQVVRTNFGLKNGVISSALTDSFHEYFRTVTVSMANGSVTDVTATPWKESTVTTEQAKKLNIITNLGHFTTRDALLAAAAKINVVQLSSDNSVRILYGTYTENSTNSVLILQHNTRTGSVSGSGSGTTMQYVFDGKERYTRYIDHNASSVTAVQSLQPEGIRNLYFTKKGFIGLRDMWGTQVGSGFFLPDNTNVREDAANTTATSVGVIITSFLGTTKTATLGAVTSARAGLMTVALYNELRMATNGINALIARLSAAEARIAQLESQLTTK